MIDQKPLQQLTEAYLVSLLCEICGISSSVCGLSTPFGELGIDSFHVLKVIHRLEAEFGTLPKSLLFEYFTIADLAGYFVSNHGDTLRSKFGEERCEERSSPRLEEMRAPAESESGSVGPARIPRNSIRITERDALCHPELKETVRDLFTRFKRESSVSRGTRIIAPNLFIGGKKRGYFNYGRCGRLLMVYGYTGPNDYLAELLGELWEYCDTQGLQLNIVSDQKLPPVSGAVFSATPFGVAQRILDLKRFTLEGGTMRRLRYQVTKFEKSGICRTVEYRPGSDHLVDTEIARIIDRWSASKSKVNPLVEEFRAEVLEGRLGEGHRLFITYRDDILQNAILISELCAEENGYLMDLEFYAPEMPLGGLEFTIVKIIEVLASEGRDLLSLGATYGCKLAPSLDADPQIDKILEELRGQNMFNDTGNLQFKNKFRTDNSPIYLSRPVGSGPADNVLDIIMMIADPAGSESAIDPDVSSDDLTGLGARAGEVNVQRGPQNGLLQIETVSVDDGDGRRRLLRECGFNPLNLPQDQVDFDMKTDSWAQLEVPWVNEQMQQLHQQLQQPANLEQELREVFPFEHFLLTESGQAAENVLFTSWPKKGIVLQNVLFPSTLFHQIDKGFVGRELPHPSLFSLASSDRRKGECDLDRLRWELERSPGEIVMACLELSNNAAAGSAISSQHLQDVKALIGKHSIPLVLDITRVVENGYSALQTDKVCGDKSVWAVVREMLSLADAIVGSLTKDLCVSRGGVIATNDMQLFRRLEEVSQGMGAGIDVIDKKLVALSLKNRKRIEKLMMRKMESTGSLWQVLRDHGVPVIGPAGGHCVVIDVKQVPEFRGFKAPVASFLAWLYEGTGIRGCLHCVGMQKETSLDELVRLAVPAGLPPGAAYEIAGRLVQLFERKENIPEVELDGSALQEFGGMHASYQLIRYHNLKEPIAAIAEAAEVSIEGQTSSQNQLEFCLAPGVVGAPPELALSDSAVMVAPSREAEPALKRANHSHDGKAGIAIVGMAGRYPKARDLDELWQNLRAGKDCIEEIPEERLELRRQQGPTTKYRGGFLKDVDKFDSLFFNISPREAAMLDPQERLFLETAWEAIENAGYHPESLSGEDGSRNVGVFVGAVWAMYQRLEGSQDESGNKMHPNSFLWSIANRVSSWMNLTGPSMTVDTACSSSLTALYLACEAIQSGECSSAIVGGVNLDLDEAKFEINSAGGGLSKDGLCRSFGRGANGYVSGEGVGALYLKPLDRAIHDNDNICGVIKSVVVNHGGRTSGYTIPNPKAQTQLIETALKKAGIDGRSISYVEAHGTGTQLGDPIEVSGLSEAFNRYAVGQQSCAVGSVKSNIGHLEAAAGIASLTKVLLQMKYRQLVPSLHSTELNEFIDFEHSPFYVVQRLEEWKSRVVDGSEVPLRAGVSSFGAGGANAHVIVENFDQKQKHKESAAPCELVFPLSARNEEELRAIAARLATALERDDYCLQDVAYTLRVGRKAFDHRVTVTATTKQELLNELKNYLDGKSSLGFCNGHVRNSESIARILNGAEKDEVLKLLFQSRTARELGELWANGMFAEWRKVQGIPEGKRVPLPTYPFSSRRHWAAKVRAKRLSAASESALHPLIDTNESTFERQIFRKTFHDRDFFICDHRVAGIPTLPGVAYLELARKAGEIAAGQKVRKIRNIVWISPISVEKSLSKEVFIELKPMDRTVRFDVFSYNSDGAKIPHSQGTLIYEAEDGSETMPEFVDLEAIRARCSKVMEGDDAYPRFDAFGLNLGTSFQVLQGVHKNLHESIGQLRLPKVREGDLKDMVLHPSLMDGALQAGMAAHLGDELGEMFVPFSIGEVEILGPLSPNCISYAAEMHSDGSGSSHKTRFVKSDVMLLDEKGKVLVKILESVGVPLRDLHKPPAPTLESESNAGIYYSYDWQRAQVPAGSSSGQSVNSVVLFDNDTKLHSLYKQRLEEEGSKSDRVILVQPGDRYESVGDGLYRVNPRAAEDYGRLLDALAENNVPVEAFCFAWPLGRPGTPDDEHLASDLDIGVYPFLSLSQALIEKSLEGRARVIYLYSTSQEESRPAHEAMGGFIKALKVEHPRLVCKTVEVCTDGSGEQEVLDAVWHELQMVTQDSTAVRYENGQRFIRKLESIHLPYNGGAVRTPGAAIKECGVYLITGGAGGLGLIFAAFLAKEYKATIVLAGRSQLTNEQETTIRTLTVAGAEVVYLRAEICDRQDAEKLIGEIKSRYGKISGILHAAGVLRDSLVRNKTTEEMAAVFAPKVFGTVCLDEATKNEDLDFFVMFSSVAAVGGNAGQCDYGYANHFMDSYAYGRERLRANEMRHGKSLSINWSLWADGGMKVDKQTELFFRKTLGLQLTGKDSGIAAFVECLASDRTQVAFVEGHQEKIETAWGLRKGRETALTVGEPTVAEAGASGGHPEQIALVEWLRTELAEIVMQFLKLETADMSTEKILLDLGFDSIGLTTFANLINEKYGLDITPVLFFDHPSIDEIAKYLNEERRPELLPLFLKSRTGSSLTIAATVEHAANAVAQPESSTWASFGVRKRWQNSRADDGGSHPAQEFANSQPRSIQNQPIAIVGMSGVMPQSEDLVEFWANLKNSKDMVTVVPPDRWRWEDYDGDPLREPNKSNSRWGGFMKEIDKFDPLFFGISPREAQMMDPQQRIFLETVWSAIEDSGHKVSDLSGTKTGLFVGVAADDYAHLMNSLGIPLDGYSASGNSHSVLANRVSFLLNLHGPSAPIDTACSSSLIALHRAVESIHSGNCEMAIVGGVQTMITPAGHISFASAGMLSSDGKCKTFDKRANGYVRGEGCGAIFLKPLARAEADCDHVYAVIKATTENHGGKVTTLTAPNSAAQASLLFEAYEKAGVDPGTVGYIECHGTGTSLGDPIEIQALTKAFSDLYKKHNTLPQTTPHCGLGSVKTNIGHLETAAGIAGILKVLLAIRHKQIPATINFEEINPYINLKGSPFYIVDKLTPWDVTPDPAGASVPRRAGISSFGFGGANAHVVLEEYVPANQVLAPGVRKPQLVVLSAKNEERLRAYAQSLHDFLNAEDVDLANLAFTLRHGRDEMQERLALVVSTNAELKQQLYGFLEGTPSPLSYRGRARIDSKHQRVVDGSSVILGAEDGREANELSKVAELWVSGGRVHWAAVTPSEGCRRISAPTYPFARERHWLAGADGKTMQAQRALPSTGASELHPMIHRNDSTLMVQKFSSLFTGREFFLEDHKADEKAILPAVAYIEMVAAAGEMAGEKKVQFLRDMVWMTPLTVVGNAVHIETSLVPSKSEVEFAVRTSNGDKPMTHCFGKLSYRRDETVATESVNISDVQMRCSEERISGEDLYGLINSSGLSLGKAFQVVHDIYLGKRECLARIGLPPHLASEASRFWLHPVLLDGAVHTAISMVKKTNPGISWCIPYSVGEVQINESLHGACYAHAVWDDNHIHAGSSFIRLNIRVMNEHGVVLLQMKEFVAKQVDRAPERPRPSAEEPAKPALENATEHGMQCLLPVWSRLPMHSFIGDPISSTARVLLIGDDESQLAWVRESFPNALFLGSASEASLGSMEDRTAILSYDEILWIAPDLKADVTGEDSAGNCVEQQEYGVIAMFRTVKALLKLGCGTDALRWTILTRKTQQVLKGDRLHAAHASVIGFMGSVAKEYPRWKLRLLDLEALSSTSALECLNLPWNKEGSVVAHRQGEWFRNELAKVASMAEQTQTYRQGGVYVVIGGAGGLGEAWSRYMIEKFQARVVWVGRRECDASIQEKVKALSTLGHAPLYITADATDRDALKLAYERIVAVYPVIHGVVHSALVLRDQDVARMEEREFRATLSAKVDASVNMDRVFGNQQLDFMLFFSSMASFVKPFGQSNYAAACCFQDAFAQSLQQVRAYPVKIMNWGFWGGIGVVADDAHNELMRRMGIGSIEPEEGMQWLSALVGSEVHQVALIKTLNGEATAALRCSETVAYHHAESGKAQRVKEEAPQQPSARPIDALEREMPDAQMNDLVTEILASSLKSLGLFSHGINSIADLLLEKKPEPHYSKWLDKSILHLQQQGILGPERTFTRDPRDLQELWVEWESLTSALAANSNLRAQIALLETCVRALPRILSGKVRATDVIFPNSSMQLVEGIYRGNVLSDFFNQALVESLTSYFESELDRDRDRKFSIIEIGAGTGGTTALLLQSLENFPVQQYLYTDVSKAFLMYGREHYGSLQPALKTAIFDVSKPLAAQGIPEGSYDVAIAANVLHATPDIRIALRNAKALLRQGGVLLLNEISNWSLFNHLTFGLLAGWWLSEDTVLRLPGSPGLSTSTWRRILAEEGFESIVFPALEAHGLGQQVISARSDGWVRQPLKTSALVPHTTPMADEEKRGATMPENGKGQLMATSPSLNGVPAQVGRDRIRRVITDNLSNALQIEKTRISSDAPLAEYGVDSIIGVDLIRTINETLQIELETVSLFEHSTVDALTEHILSRWPDAASSGPGQPQRIAQHSATVLGSQPAHLVEDVYRFQDNGSAGKINIQSESTYGDVTGTRDYQPIAIIGMSGRFADSETLEEFWQNLEQGRNLIGSVSRWSSAECAGGGAEGAEYCSHGSFIRSIDRFDPSFFRISPEEAVYMDPQQRLLLEECWKALESAGYAGTALSGSQCGVYIGCGMSGYGSLFSAEPPAHAFWGNSPSIIPARIAYHLNLQGPAIAVDTACSSSLVSVHLACQGLWSGETDVAIAGGVCLHPTPSFWNVANRAHMLSTEGECRSFDGAANGFVPGEGVGVVVLKPLQDALRDGDHIEGVIAGSAINQDGTSNGLIAPNARAQEKLETLVYERFGINPETVQMIEAHGTGTILGDSIEFLAISRAFRKYTDKKQFCAIGTVKTNLGHTGPASGVAGILKLLLALKHGMIPPTLHFHSASAAIDLESSPFYVATQAREWPGEDGRKRRGIVSSFGFSGTNAHLVIEEGPQPTSVNVQSRGSIVVLSARSQDQLRQQVLNLLTLVKKTPSISMSDLSFTLLMGRAHLSYRLACAVQNREELIQALEQWSEAGDGRALFLSEGQEPPRENPSLKRFGNHCIKECRVGIDAISNLENLAAIAELYVKGYGLEFQGLFPQGTKRIPLPTYPFARERYWITPVDQKKSPAEHRADAMHHPLLQVNTSTLSRVSYTSRFTGDEEFVVPASLPGGKVLAESACLEMAWLGLQRAALTFHSSSILELTGVTWLKPIVIAGSTEITLALHRNEGEEIGFEIIGADAGGETSYFLGRAVTAQKPPHRSILLNQLSDDLQRKTEAAGTPDANETWAGFSKECAGYQISEIKIRDEQLLAKISQCGEGGGTRSTESGWAPFPKVIAAALHAASVLAEGSPRPLMRARAIWSLKRFRILSACTQDTFLWARYSRSLDGLDKLIEVDIDLADADGNVVAELHGLSLQSHDAKEVTAIEPRWLFSMDSIAESGKVVRNTLMDAEEKIELFLKQEIALQSHLPMKDISLDQTYFDLGLSSLAMTNLLQKTNCLLKENLAPSALFEYKDIKSLSGYLVAMYRTKIDALAIIRADGQFSQFEADSGHSSTSAELTAAAEDVGLCTIPTSSEHSEPLDSDVDWEQSVKALDSVLWQESSSHDGFEKVTF